ncbi:hypothetical protein BH11BAC3_BH11BAC3_45610 [soil metagenome]
MNLLYMAFGPNAQIHLQTSFSIYSFLTPQQGISTVNIITDNDYFYNHFGNRVNIIKITSEELKSWEGAYHFFWRIKIKAIEKVCSLYKGQPVLYLDCDTFLYGDLATMQSALQRGVGLMHENEGPLSLKKNKTQKRMWQEIKGKSFAGISIQTGGEMWNSGVVGLPNNKGGKDCEQLLALCDEMCSAGVTRYFIEQYALSVGLKEIYGLEEAKPAVIHYWSVKSWWDKEITGFFLRAYFECWGYEQILAEMKLFDLTAIPYFQKVKNTNLRLKYLIDKIFPHEDIRYLPGN